MSFVAPLIIRGRIIEDNLVEFEGRRGGVSFRTPDVHKYIDEIPLSDPTDAADYYALSLNEIIDFLCELGTRLPISRNLHMREAFEVSKGTSGLTPAILEYLYETGVPNLFNRKFLEDTVERGPGRAHVEGWVPTVMADGRTISVRAFGARTVHVNAGNNPSVAALSLARSALIRSDAIIKSPSNDPLTAAALARTLVEMAPDHPVTRHFSVAYWKGGDEAFESRLYRNNNIEKIVAWGGFDSMKHIAKYLGPGIDLVPMDPKLSATIVGAEALADDEAMRVTARKLACDIAGRNQEPCTSARVVFVQSGTHPEGIARLNAFGALVFEAIQALPPKASGPHPNFSPMLRDEIQGIRLGGWHHILGGKGNEGAIIVSQHDETVDFWEYLGGRVANLVPVDAIDDAVRRTTCHTGTTGIYPESLKEQVRNNIALRGGQRVVSLGHQNNGASVGVHDAIEPMRRMVRWIVDERIDAEVPTWAMADPSPEIAQENVEAVS